MNTTQLRKLGIPDECLTAAITAVQRAATEGNLRGKEIKQAIAGVLAAPSDYAAHPYFGSFAVEVMESCENGNVTVTPAVISNEADDFLGGKHRLGFRGDAGQSANRGVEGSMERLW